MILGRDRHPAAACFDELEAALVALGRGDVVLNAHAFSDEIPPGAVVYNLENLGIQVQTDAFEGHEVWDFSARNVAAWTTRIVSHVPVGFHPSMQRFAMRPWAERDIDVVFCGAMNERRQEVVRQIEARGLKMCIIPPGAAYGAERDALLARSKVALNMLFHEGGLFPALRAAHCVANRLAVVSEDAPERPRWAINVADEAYQLAERCEQLCRFRVLNRELAEAAHQRFADEPMTLPEMDMSIGRVARVFGGFTGMQVQGDKGPIAVIPDPYAEVAALVARGPIASASPFDDPRWSMLHDKDPADWDLGAMYAAAGSTVEATPCVAVIVPSYRESERIAQVCRVSRNEVRKSLAEHGIHSVASPINGDSLVCRMRQRAVHMFLLSPATHMLFWDADIECITPDCVQAMLATGHDVIAGACPFKDKSGRTVHNLHDDTPPVVVDGCVEVRDAGTGFMLISRRALLALMQAHPELLHWSVSTDRDRGAPLWALFDTAIIDGIYQSEDYYFCRLWQQHGGKVYVYAPAQFRHWGEHGFEASFLEQHGLTA